MQKMSLYLCINLLLFSISWTQEFDGKIEQKDGITYIQNTDKGLLKGKLDLQFNEVLTIGSENDVGDGILVMPFDIKTDLNENIYVCDWMEDFIKVYDKNGKYIRKIGSRGQGPGELQEPQAIEIMADSHICVMDHFGGYSKMLIYQLDGEFIRSFGISGLNITDIAYDNINKQLYFSPITRLGRLRMMNNKDHHYAVLQYDIKGQFIKEFSDHEGYKKIEGVKHYSKLVTMTINQNRDLLVAFSYPYIIKIYDSDGNYKKHITRKSRSFKKPKIVDHEILGSGYKTVGEYFSIGDILSLPDNGFIVIYRVASGKRRKTYYDVYNSEGYFLESFPGKNERLMHIDQNGYAYTTGWSDDIPQVKKYKIEFINK